MKKSTVHIHGISIILLIILSGCSNIPTEAAPTLIPSTQTTIPTKLPTVTSSPTIEPPAMVMDFLTDVQILSFDPFDNGNNWDWNRETSSFHDGIFEIKGKSFWASSFALKQAFKEGDGLKINFKLLNANGQSEFVFLTGEWLTDSFRQFGIWNDRNPRADLFQGENMLGGNNLVGNLSLQPDMWYSIIMAIGKNGEFFSVMWDPRSEGHSAVYREGLGEKWIGKTWLFLPKVNEGEILYVDDFYRFSFGEIR